MTVTLAQARTAIAQRLEAAIGVRVYKHMPADGVGNEFPCIILRDMEGEYTPVYGGQPLSGRLRCMVVVQSADAEQAWAELETFLTPTGDKSISKALQADQHVGLGNEFAVAATGFTRAGYRPEAGDQLAADITLTFMKEG